MAARCPGPGIDHFRRGDNVAITSTVGLSEIRVDPPTSSDFDTSSMPHLLPGALVKIVDDIRGDGNLNLQMGNHTESVTQVDDEICIVLDDNATDRDRIRVKVGEKHEYISRCHLEFVARPLIATTKSTGDLPNNEALTEALIKELEESMQSLPDADVVSISRPSQWTPGKFVTVTNDVKERIRWHQEHFGESHWTQYSGAAKEIERLLDPGKVLQMNSDGDVIVLFYGSVWCLRSSVLRLDESEDLLSKGTDKETPLSVELAFFLVYVPSSQFPQSQLSLEKAKTRLLGACFYGSKKATKWMVISNHGLECEDANGNTPLHYAAYGNQPEMINYLLREGANINAANKRLHTALQFAVKKGFVECVRKLTKFPEGPNTNMQDDMGNTALHVAIATMNAENVNALIKFHGVDFSITNKSGNTPLHMAALKGNALAAANILSRRSDLVDVQEENQGYAALHFAADGGHYTVVEKLLMQESCTVDLRNKHQDTALLLAARNGHWRIVDLLLLAGADKNQADRHGNTVLHMSVKNLGDKRLNTLDMPTSCAMNWVKKKIQDHGHTGVDDGLLLVYFLVRGGANIHCRNETGVTPLNIASNLSETAVQLLLSAGSGDKDSGNCEKCQTALANPPRAPLGHCLYCDDCGRRITRCHSCTKFIVAKTPTAAGSKGPNEMTPFKRQVVPATMFKKGPELYPMTRYPRGWCIIVNNSNFVRDSDYRDGSEIDVHKMDALFTELHFKVAIRSDLSVDEMKHLLSQVSEEESQKDADCLVVILMSHGNEGIIYGSDGEELDLYRDVYWRFSNEDCPALQGKPKLFFVQACRGSEYNNGTDDVRETSDTPQAADERPAATSRQTPKRMSSLSDMYIAHATIPGYVAYRNPERGSWFLEAVSEVFSEHACSTSLSGLMSLVHAKVMDLSAKDGSKQTPNVNMDGWRKELYFNPGFYDN